MENQAPQQNVSASFVQSHSTLLGFAMAALATCLVGLLSNWSAVLVAATAVAGVAVFPRMFYGFRAARALDKDRSGPATMWFSHGRNWYGSPPEEERIDRALELSCGDITKLDSKTLRGE